MRKASTELSQSRGLKRRPLLRTSSPLKPKINRGLTFGLVQQTGAHQSHTSALQRLRVLRSEAALSPESKSDSAFGTSGGALPENF